MATVSVIIVNWNGAGVLKDCLTSLSAQDYRDFDTVLVDNGSGDDSLAVVRALAPDARVIACRENLGFASGVNAGLRVAEGRYIVLLNNDTAIDPGCLRELVAAADEDEAIGMVAPKIVNFHDPRVIDSVGGLLVTADGIGQGRGRGEHDGGQYDGLRDVLLPSGCAGLYRAAMLNEIGPFADEFFAYCEDLDLGLRGRWAGWRAVSAPRAVVRHKYSATTGAYSPVKLFLVERNHYFVVLRNFPLSSILLVPFWTLFRIMVMAYAAALGRGKGVAASGVARRSLLAAFLKGNWEALRGAPGQLRRRPAIRRLSRREFRALLLEHRLSVSRLLLDA